MCGDIFLNDQNKTSKLHPLEDHNIDKTERGFSLAHTNKESGPKKNSNLFLFLSENTQTS